MGTTYSFGTVQVRVGAWRYVHWRKSVAREMEANPNRLTVAGFVGSGRLEQQGQTTNYGKGKMSQWQRARRVSVGNDKFTPTGIGLRRLLTCGVGPVFWDSCNDLSGGTEQKMGGDILCNRNISAYNVEV